MKESILNVLRCLFFRKISFKNKYSDEDRIVYYVNYYSPFAWLVVICSIIYSLCMNIITGLYNALKKFILELRNETEFSDFLRYERIKRERKNK